MFIDYVSNKIENPEFCQEGVLKPRSTVVPALKRDVFYKNHQTSDLIQILNGDFKFNYQNSDIITDFYFKDFNDNEWDTIDVPSMWQYRGYSAPTYPNVEYPIPFDPPYISCENPVGYYRKKFFVNKTEKTILYFGGVDNAFFVYLNGEYVGFSKGSRLPAEFDVTDKVINGENLLAVKVFTYSDATYLENQDMLLANGIFRDVLIFNLSDTYIFDYYIKTENNKVFIDVTLEGSDFENCFVEVEIGIQKQNLSAKKELHFEFEVENPKLWNAEEPNLYTAYITLLKEDTALEIHTKKFGFRESHVEGNRLLLNGKPITIKGICRHEHCSDNGRAITVDLIETELKNIKSHNMNAIRCAHYTNNPAFYEIASELGIYVMNENDLETHGCEVVGDQGYLSKDPKWLKAYLNRTERMIERDKNETCIIIWSAGNEHGCGENIDKSIELIRKKFGNTPVYHTMDNNRKPEVGDFRGDGYFKMASLTGWEPEGEPVMLLEYGHAMGNSPGLMADTWDYVYRNRHILGGYLWEYKNHGFVKTDENGDVYYQYGGDFGDYNHWSNFNMDGYCLADGTPKPSLRDCKNVLAPCYTFLKDGKICVLNTNDFKSLDYISLKWEICEDYHTIKSGDMKLPSIAPYEEYILPINTDIDNLQSGATYFANLKFYDAAENEIAVKQLQLFSAQKTNFIGEKPQAKITHDSKKIEISSDNFNIKFENGLLSHYEINGKILIEQPIKLNFYRAPTDNDGVIGWYERWIAEWKNIFLKHFEFHARNTEITEESDCLKICVSGKALPTGRFVGFHVTLIYRIYKNGLILVEYEGKPFGVFKEVMPRIGLIITMREDFENIEWYGRGPDENYCDRKAHCNFGLYSSPVSKLNFIYDIPQECGNHEETAFVRLKSESDALSVIGSEKFAFSCHDFSLADLEKARHRNELRRSREKYLYIDYKMRGLGSLSCGPDPEECYELHPHSFRFAFALCDANTTSEALELSRKAFCAKTEALSEAYRFAIQNTEKSVIECNINP